MLPIFKFFIRIILIIVIFLFYLKYRNNQCIINQNCKPYFISNILNLKKDFENQYIVGYKIIDNLADVDILTDPSINVEKISKTKNLKQEEIESLNYMISSFRKNFGYVDINLIENNDIIVKKFSLKNTANFPVKVMPKMTFNDNIFKIYNCFCGSQFIVGPNSMKDIYIYYQIKNLPKKILEKFKNDANSSHQDFVITISI
jgi:hypothetical protein